MMILCSANYAGTFSIKTFRRLLTLLFVPSVKSLQSCCIYIIINVLFGSVLDDRGPIWACDGSLEPSCHKNDHVMGKNRFARAARPQRAKMCIFTRLGKRL